MSIIQKLVKVINAGDENGAKEVMHDDFKFLMHASGKTLSKEDVVKWVGMKDVKLEKTLIELDRQFLHAQSIGFVHPRTGQELEFTSKLPKDLELVLKKLKNANK